MDEATIQNVGPIQQLSIPLPPGGGVTVLLGSNDIGKSEALRAVKRAAGGDERLTKRDKTTRGQVDVLGVRLSVMASTRQIGEAEFSSLEGRLDVSDLVDPGMEDPAAADRKRIRALLTIRGIQADPARFYDLAGGREDFEALVKPDTLTATDLVDMAAKVRRDLHNAARIAQDEATKQEGHIAACREQLAGVDLSAECDQEKLQTALLDAVREASTLDARHNSAAEASRKAAAAAGKLQDAQSSYKGLTVDAACTQALARQEDLEDARKRVQAAKEALEMASQSFRDCERSLHEAQQQRAAANEHQAAMNGWRQAIEEAADVDAPSNEEISAAHSAVDAARASVEQGAIVRKAKETLVRLGRHIADASRQASKAEELRASARATDAILSQAVQSRAIRVVSDDKGNPRLITDHPERGEVYYAERSTGTRWRIALDEAIERIRELGGEGRAVIPIDQVAWESLDNANRQAIDRHARAKGVNIITAEAIDGPLRAIVFGEDGNGSTK